MRSVLVLFLILLVKTIDCARILAVFPCPGYSQFILGERLIQELSRRGHDVTLISAFKPNPPMNSYRHISTSGLLKLTESEDLFEFADQNIITDIIAVNDLGFLLTEYTLAHKDVQKLIKSNETFDLVLLEQFFNEAMIGFAYHFKAPLILLSSLGSSEWTNNLVGNPGPPSYMPNTFTDYTSNMSFLQRIRNSFIHLFDSSYKYFVTFPKQNEFLKNFFPYAPKLETIVYNASLILLNSHPSVNIPVPHVPNMIEIGGFHISPKPLAPELQNFLDEAKDGAIFFSMGSNLKSTNFPKDKLEAILRVFSKLPQKILWKFEGELSNKPNNLKVEKWLPQRDILGHPHVLAFISHCGLLSLTEAVYHGIPVVGIPIFGDQRMNAANAIKNGYAVSVPFKEINEDKLFHALNEVINNARINAKSRSRIMHDRPIKPLDNAMYWIEYVIRHKGAMHLRTESLNLTWYQYLLLDVICSFILLILLVFYLLRFVITNFKRKTSIKTKTKRN